ncbi:hypothetical protein O9G_005133 [Rozella allomycis CSF55]|uniref:Uncharacterized protein n=1 Tax=Rozella allomycis (strain CSF55) TaxID=988480 RepID=A0A075AZK7_ROZAC|nr:hypothetical protein O9G_005133 [Rozella allomycis CSF55]|eukprot:EPZ35687.1 hypothetical protein O9G_005133 [Rozella allomycis CSF55]
MTSIVYPEINELSKTNATLEEEHGLNADNTTEYLVKGKAHDPSNNQWVKETDFHDLTPMRKGKTKI